MLLLDMHRLGRVASQLMRKTLSDIKLNETQLLILVRMREASLGSDGYGSSMAPIDLAQTIVCPDTTVVTQIHNLVERGLIELDHQKQVRDHSPSGRQIYRLSQTGIVLVEHASRQLSKVDDLLRGAVHRQSDLGVRSMSELLHEWSRRGALNNPDSLKRALTSFSVRIPRRRR